jgi:hypothetical protein
MGQAKRWLWRGNSRLVLYHTVDISCESLYFALSYSWDVGISAVANHLPNLGPEPEFSLLAE